MGVPHQVCIGDYTVIKTLGTGSTGKVKLARHPLTHELVALKIIRQDLLDRKRTLFEKVRREIAVMKLVAGNCLAAEKNRKELATTLPEPLPEAHIGIMQLLDVYETDSSFVLVLEYCSGGELFDILMKWGRLSDEQVLDVFQQLVYAIDFCHRRGICHRDLKPENVLLTSDGRVKLADFGMASLHMSGSLLETSCGSPQYCAPEVILGEPYAGCAADVWSLGVVLYAMTTGGLPFDDDNLRRLVSKINSGAFYMPEEVSPDLATVIHSMLTVDPSERAKLSDIMQSDWFQSVPPRSDIYREEDYAVLESLPMPEDEPVFEPDPAVVKYLCALGLGDGPTIRRRLRSDASCLERDLYYQLVQLCGDSLSFRPVDSIPTSPKRPCADRLKQSAMEGSEALAPDETQMTDKGGDTIEGNLRSKGMSLDLSQTAWLEQIAVVLPLTGSEESSLHAPKKGNISELLDPSYRPLPL